ncbi:unnamed protein product [Effrenium voratum]|uniref:Uncharacterized protein n=1 Tax=Effrenium voratum TaxID=2562239 RepID=A0AA36MPY3_9DINO|nr:unnamed protein product [Effrenium voratum]
MCMYRWCRFRRRETAWRKFKRSKTRSQAWERGLVWDRFCWSVAQVALNAMSQEFRSSYADAAPYFNQPEVALALVLCSAVRWPAEGRQLVPGTSLRWSDISGPEQHFQTTSLYWFHGCGGVRIPISKTPSETI